jgi:hypothetical protein
MIIRYGGDIMSIKRYRSVNLPSGLYARVKKLVKSRNDLGYRSVTEFVAESVRKRVEEIEKVTSFSSELDNK